MNVFDNSAVQNLSGITGSDIPVSSNNSASVDNTNQMMIDMFNASNAFNSAEAEKNRQFQERMSNTQYSRAMADLERAGLNPLLAFSGLSGSAPAGSAASSAGSPSLGNNQTTNSAMLRGASQIISAVLKIIALAAAAA